MPSAPAPVSTLLETDAVATDAVVIGAGPVGLFQVFELGLLDIQAHLIDALPHVGGQCIELYADKPIFDIPGVPRCTGRELVENLQKQMAPFNAVFHGGQLVQSFEQQADGRFLVETSKGARLLTKTVFVAAGVGAFLPRTLQVPGIDLFRDTQLHYHPTANARYAGKDVVILGDKDSALEFALDLCSDGVPHKAKSVTVLHRRDVFDAAPETLQVFREKVAAGQLQLQIGQITGFDTTQGQLAALVIADAEGHTHTLGLDYLAAFPGLSPKLGPVSDWGLALDRKQLTVNTETFATNVPGIFAVGDINTYPGKKKLILCGFHEATLAAFGAAAIVFPDQKIGLQYTTTSTKLHKTLGIL
ncbi:MAG: NAD(P)/FAD-dependent oxidoreductase [Rhodoferax sp.]|nr:NAD(P)/FAD-dependent oxidoreductase [Rhodoferax sp.]